MSSATTPDKHMPPLVYLESARDFALKAKQHDLVSHFDNFKTYYQKRLWHQLTVEMEQFAALTAAGPYLVPFYNNFVRDFETKLNKLSLVAVIGVAVARQLNNTQARIDFLSTLADNVKAANVRASLPVSARAAASVDNSNEIIDVELVSAELLARTHAAHYQLLAGHYDLVTQHIRDSEQVLDKLRHVDPRLSCVFYRVAADCYKAQAAYAKFYRTSLLFLSYLEPAKMTLSPEESLMHVHSLCIAGLLSDEIYNFGELLAHPIIEFLSNSKHAWLRDFLAGFNRGDIGCLAKFEANVASETILVSKKDFLWNKLCVMALIDFVFNRSTRDRVFTFDEIAARIASPKTAVEHVIMRAMSLNLIRGTIEQVSNQVVVTWVTPRILDRAQISGLAEMLGSWESRVSTSLKTFTEESGDLFIHA